MRHRRLRPVHRAAVVVMVALLSACAAPPATPLENTDWKLTSLKGQPVGSVDPQHEAYLTLQPEQKRIAGSSGCNRFVGSYTLDGAHLSFGQVAGTRMACMQGMEQERALLDAFEIVARWRVSGTHLDLLTKDGQVLATFDARRP